MGADKSGGSVVRTKDQALAVAREVVKRAKAGEDLGWKPRTSFEELIRLMTRADLDSLSSR